MQDLTNKKLSLQFHELATEYLHDNNGIDPLVSELIDRADSRGDNELFRDANFNLTISRGELEEIVDTAIEEAVGWYRCTMDIRITDNEMLIRRYY